MGARQAVLLTPSESSYPLSLPFYKHRAPISPVFATHTKTTGVYTNNSYFETQNPPLAAHRPQVISHESPACPDLVVVTSHQSLADRIWTAAIPGATNV